MWRMITIFAVGLGLFLPAELFASAIVDVNSDLSASVSLDGKPIGYAPLRIAHVPGGRHMIRVHALHGHGTREFVLTGPYGARVQRSITACFGQLPAPSGHSVVVVETPPVVVRTVRPAPIVVLPARRHYRHW